MICPSLLVRVWHFHQSETNTEKERERDWHFLCWRETKKTGWQESHTERRLHFLQLSSVWKQLCLNCSQTSLKNCSKSCDSPTLAVLFPEILKRSQASPSHHSLMRRHGPNQWVWRARRLVLEKHEAPSDCSSSSQPECCQHTGKWPIMIINTQIRHLLWFQGCL